MSISLDPGLLLENHQSNQKKASNDLGKDAFMKILMTQLRNQNPLEPLQDKDFIAQMATFSSLEQLTNMNEQLRNIVHSDTSLNLAKYGELIGKAVEWVQDSDSNTIGTGVVESVRKLDNEFYLELSDGQIVNPKYIYKVSAPE